MANLTVTFTNGQRSGRELPIMDGTKARTFEIAIGAASVDTEDVATTATGTGAAAKGEHIVRLLAEAACWVAVADAPTAVAGSGFKMLSGTTLELWVSEDTQIAAIEV